MDSEEEAVGGDGQEGGEALDGVHEGDGDSRCGVRGEDVAADLEDGEGERGHY